MGNTLFIDEQSGAKFNQERTERYFLYRKWDLEKHNLMLIGLNPSTANEETDDPTIRRIISLARSNGYGGIYMTNLFPMITAYPSELKFDVEAVIRNDYWLEIVYFQWCRDICFCWGNFNVLERDRHIEQLYPSGLCFGKNKNGSPKHPLYLKADTKLIKY